MSLILEYELMIRLILSFIAVSIGFLVVVVSVLAVEKSQATPSAVMVSEASESAALMAPEPVLYTNEIGDYYLPYPGLLPDHPFYFLKMLRDRVRLLMANSATKKFELQLLYADKRVGAADVLIQGGKAELAHETAVKAEGYLEMALETSKLTGDQAHRQTLGQAVYKHAQVLEQIRQATSDDRSRIEEAQTINRGVAQVLGVELPPVPEPISAEEPTEASLIEEIIPAEIAR